MTFKPKMWVPEGSQHIVMETSRGKYLSWSNLSPSSFHVVLHGDPDHLPPGGQSAETTQHFHPWWDPNTKPCYVWDYDPGAWRSASDDMDEDAPVVQPPPVPGFVPLILETIDARDPYGAYHSTFGHTGSKSKIDMPKIRKRISYYKRTLREIPQCPDHGSTVCLGYAPAGGGLGMTQILLYCTVCDGGEGGPEQ